MRPATSNACASNARASRRGACVVPSFTATPATAALRSAVGGPTYRDSGAGGGRPGLTPESRRPAPGASPGGCGGVGGGDGAGGEGEPSNAEGRGCDLRPNDHHGGREPVTLHLDHYRVRRRGTRRPRGKRPPELHAGRDSHELRPVVRRSVFRLQITVVRLRLLRAGRTVVVLVVLVRGRLLVPGPLVAPAGLVRAASERSRAP